MGFIFGATHLAVSGGWFKDKQPEQKSALAFDMDEPTVLQLLSLRDAVIAYISEFDKPVPDYNYRRTLRNHLQELARDIRRSQRGTVKRQTPAGGSRSAD